LSIEIRRLGIDDGEIVSALADYPGFKDRFDLLGDERTLFFVAFADSMPIGFLLAYELPRRHGDRSMLFVYEVDVELEFRRQGVATALFQRLSDVASARGIRELFVLTEPDNDAANALYASLGGSLTVVNQWDIAYTAR
jgi:ribosomal protein S18 acetylase RimI-like enzyme